VYGKIHVIRKNRGAGTFDTSNWKASFQKKFDEVYSRAVYHLLF